MSKNLPLFTFLLMSVLFSGSIMAIDENPSSASSGHNELHGNYISELQPVLAQQAAWQTFAANNGWSALFEQRNGLPSRAFGPPMALRSAGTPAQAAEQFLSEQLGSFGMGHVRFKKESDITSAKYQYLKFRQEYNGVQVMHTDIDARLDLQGRLVMFGLDIFEDIDLNTTPAVDREAVLAKMRQKYGDGIEGLIMEPAVKILPLTANNATTYKLVYIVTVYGATDGRHFDFKNLIDAHTGDLIEEKNLICNLSLNVKAGVTDNPLKPKVIRSLPYVKVRYNSVNYIADQNGNVALPDFSGEASVRVYLEGTYAKVIKAAGGVPSYDLTVNSANPNISLDGIAKDVEISAYYNVTAQHIFMKDKLPSFTGLDINMGTNIDLDYSTCNAFYTPTAKQVNFFKEGGGCKNTALFNDVIFHEYGHAINYEYSSSLGGDMGNGCLQEGYADVWAFIHTNDPVIGNGFGDSTPYVRRYDMEPRVYPEDMVGEVHYDGEIIAGAWWDLKQSLGLIPTQNLFLETLLTKPDQVAGQEGKLYTQILLDVLLADDSDGNLTNGTPNSQAIIDAFARHGITLYTSLIVLHTEDVMGDSLSAISLSATFTGLYNTSLITGKTLYYKKRGTVTWMTVPASISASTLSGTIPAQTAGSIIDYYFKLNFINGQTLYCPTYVNASALPEFPYNALVNYKKKSTEDFDNSVLPGWTILPDAFKGDWAMVKTVGSKLSLSINYTWSRDVQIGYDFTPGSATSKCYITGNATASDPAGLNDVDSGRTTLKSPVYDVSSYKDPLFTYYRFYTCDRGANPGTDTFKVYLSNNDGAPVLVERSMFTDWKWRRNVIRLKDYFPTPGNIKATFVADDMYRTDLDNGGGSLVEAGIDDVIIYDLDRAVASGLQEQLVETGYSLFPNPVSDKLTLQITEPGQKLLGYQVFDSKGAIIKAGSGSTRGQEQVIDLSGVADGTYFLFFETPRGKTSARFVKSH